MNAYDLDEAVFSGIKGQGSVLLLNAVFVCMDSSIVRSDPLPFYTDTAYFYKCPDRLRLPLVFYVAHPASVYINKLLLAGMIEVSYSAALSTICSPGSSDVSLCKPLV